MARRQKGMHSEAGGSANRRFWRVVHDFLRAEKESVILLTFGIICCILGPCQGDPLDVPL